MKVKNSINMLHFSGECIPRLSQVNIKDENYLGISENMIG